MVIGISPLVDFAFKQMLGNSKHAAVTIHFLNAILAGQPRITAVKFLNPILDKEFTDDKLSVLDVYATDEHGRHLNIEVQTSLPAGMSQRLTYYVAATYAGQLTEGQDYPTLRPSISICVLAQPMFFLPPALHLDFRMRERSTNLVLTDDLQIHLLQLNFLQVDAETVYNASPVERWAWFLRNAESLTTADVRRLFPDEEFTEAAGVLEMIAKTPEQLFAYNARLKSQRDEAARILFARQEGEQIGEARGIEIGAARGRQIGRINLLRDLLCLPAWTEADFCSHDTTQLCAIADQLQQQMRDRMS
jgi:predicted transposase/invertase (TIGR01784 family)